MIFNCKKCGDCCKRGGGAEIYLDNALIISCYLSMTIDNFIKTYVRKKDDYYYFGEKNKPCPFLKTDGCSIYAVRPRQCRTYPFWESIVQSKKRWNKESKICRGITTDNDGGRDDIEKGVIK